MRLFFKAIGLVFLLVLALVMLICALPFGLITACFGFALMSVQTAIGILIGAEE
jgi:hypothetical protein